LKGLASLSSLRSVEEFEGFRVELCDMGFGIWNLELGTWNLELGSWNLVPGI